jgi:D-sedoheptulose 7-phosphate isomerase
VINLKDRFLESAKVKENIASDDEIISKIEKVAVDIIEALKKGNKVLLCGNGGSAADAQHIAAELLGKFYLHRKALPAVALNTNGSILTAVANDYSYDDVFSRQVEGLGREGDILIGISTSGNSKNVINAIKKAKEMGIKTIGLSGKNGGKMKELSDICICVPSNSTPRIQEAHITIGHVICEIVEREMFKPE